MDKQSTHQKKPAAPTRSHPTKTSVKSPVHQEDDLQGAIGNRQMGLLMETHPHFHPSSPNATIVGEMPMLGGMMPVSQGRIQRQPLFGGLSQEMRLENATLALPATGALVQRKLTLGTPGDMYEQEADRVARQVVDEIHSSPNREQNSLSEEERIPAGGEAGRVQRQITVRSAGDAGGELSSEWEGELQRAKSGGQPLSPSVKEPMERAFGADFGGVRVHTEAQADGLARSIQAKAFTTGQDMFFRQGAYEPGSRGGQELLAHELTHVEQQKKVLEKEKSNEVGVRRKIYISVNQKMVEIKDEKKIIGENENYGGNKEIMIKVASAMIVNPQTFEYESVGDARKEILMRVMTINYIKQLDESDEYIFNPQDNDIYLNVDYWDSMYGKEKESEEDEYGSAVTIVEGQTPSNALYAITEAIGKGGDEKYYLDCSSAILAATYRAILEVEKMTAKNPNDGEIRFNNEFSNVEQPKLVINLGGIDLVRINSETAGWYKTPSDEGTEEVTIDEYKDLIPGDQVYFANFGDYEEKHDNNAAWAGEHTIYKGDDMFIGFGMSGEMKSEELCDLLYNMYNEGLKNVNDKRKEKRAKWNKEWGEEVETITGVVPGPDKQVRRRTRYRKLKEESTREAGKISGPKIKERKKGKKN